MVTHTLECPVEPSLSKVLSMALQLHRHTAYRGSRSSSVAQNLRSAIRPRPLKVISVKAGSKDDLARAKVVEHAIREAILMECLRVRSFDDEYT